MNRFFKVLLTLTCVSFALLALNCQTWAISLSFNPSASTINIGDSMDIDIAISGLENDNLGVFNFDIGYDSSVLTFNSYALGDGLGDISLFEAEDWSWGDLGGGTINLSELSWLWDLSAQPDAFTLATLSFTGSGEGTSPLSFSNVALSEDGFSYFSADLTPGSVTVNNPVPEPCTCMLLFFGVLGMVGIKRKFQKN